MSRDAGATRRSLAFGDLASASWGAVWDPGGGEVTISFGAGAQSASARVAIAGWDAEEQWRLAGGAVDLVVSSERAAAETRDADGDPGGFDQLCQVTGRFVVDGVERTVDCPGCRGLRTAVELSQLDSVRDVSAWFGADEGLALVSLRPQGAAGHERDLVSAAVFQALDSVPVTDPRLSTTYTAAGLPARAGLELWLGDEQREQYPYRAAGESTGGRVDLLAEGLELHAAPIRWRSHALEGAGIYLLARRR